MKLQTIVLRDDEPHRAFMAGRLVAMFTFAALATALLPTPALCDAVAEARLSMGASTSEITVFKRGNDVRYNHPMGSTIRLANGELILLHHESKTVSVIAPAAGAKQPAARPAVRNASRAVYQTVVTDLGEVREMHGLQARRLRTVTKLIAGSSKCSAAGFTLETEGWYADGLDDILTFSLEDFRVAQVRQDLCVADEVQYRTVKPGTPLAITGTMRAVGLEQALTLNVTSISRDPLDAALFSTPSMYALVAHNSPGARDASFAGLFTGTHYSQFAGFQPRQSVAPQQLPPVAMPVNPAAVEQMRIAALISAAGSGPGLAPAVATPAVVETPLAAAPKIEPKKPGATRIGVLAPKVQMSMGNLGGYAGQGVWNEMVRQMRGPAVDVVQLVSVVKEQIDAEAAEAQCDYVLHAEMLRVVKKKGGMFGKVTAVAQTATGAMAVTQMMKAGAGLAAAGAAQTAAIANQAAAASMSQISSGVKARDEVTLSYQLYRPGKVEPELTHKLLATASQDGEDVLSPLIGQTASAVISHAAGKSKN